MTHTTTVLVTGATGRVGGAAVAELLDAGVTVRALTREPERARLPREVEVHRGDLGHPSDLEAALDGTDGVLLVFPTLQTDAAAPELAALLARRTGRVAYLSAHGAGEPGAEESGGIVGSHARVERLLRESGVPTVALRASGFAANTLGWAEQVRCGDEVRWFHPEARRALVDERDLGAVARVVLLGDAVEESYHVTGPEQLTQREQLGVIGSVLGRDLRFVELDRDQVRDQLLPSASEELVSAIVDGHAAMVREPEPMTDTVAALLGRPARTYEDWVRHHVADFR